ncbi:40S ribosomal protein S6, partial [Galemys pyrenaicus]
VADSCLKIKLNIPFPDTGCKKPIDVDDECKFCTFMKTYGHRWGEGYSWTHGYNCLLSWGPKSQKNPNNFTLSGEDNLCCYAVGEPLNKAGKNPSTKAPKTRHLVTPCVQDTNGSVSTKENKEKTTEYAKILAKRMKEVKEKTSRNRLPRDRS